MKFLSFFAHSMGNVVTSEALRIEAMGLGRRLVSHYVATQSATVAHAYDAEGLEVTQDDESTQTPEIYRAYPVPENNPHPYFSTISGSSDGISSAVSGRNITNFHNAKDIAFHNLIWVFNQDTKPDAGWDYSRGAYIGFFGETEYSFPEATWNRKVDQSTPAEQLYLPGDRYEIFSYIAEARSYALGREPATRGEISNSFDLDQSPHNFGAFTYGHSAQFLSTIQRRYPYWNRLLDTFKFELVNDDYDEQ
ncbi:MAG: hypothetical protein GY934_23055 [Gammaproteobacteria bacterium]|nr:hypothetical protein [Gammaproteobacteria bacterium]